MNRNVDPQAAIEWVSKNGDKFNEREKFELMRLLIETQEFAIKLYEKYHSNEFFGFKGLYMPME